MSELGWHFLADDGKMQFDKRIKVVAGKTYSIKAEPVLCQRGFHASEKALDALGFAPGSLVCRVRLSGTILKARDKMVAQSREVLWMADATQALHEFSLWVAKDALMRERKAGREPDPRSWNVLKIKKLWLKGKVTDQDLDAAWDAARAVAWDAAGAAWAVAGAARAAAWDAAWAARAASWAAAGAAARAAAWAARDAARDAAWAARDAARDARAASWAAAGAVAWARHNKKLTKMLYALEPK